jgi:hypothetical protein
VAELVTNAFDANAALGLDCDPLLEGSGAGTVIEIRDVGRGLDKSSFAIGRHGEGAADNTQKRFGRFGLGLKDAIAVLVRFGFQITIHSQVSDFEFFVRSGGLAVSTIWARVLPPTEQQGTAFILRHVGGSVHLADCPSDSPPADVLRSVQARFLAFTTQAPEVLFQTDDVDIFHPNVVSKKKKSVRLFMIESGGGSKPALFGIGRAIEIQQPTRFGYHFKRLSPEQKQTINRDHCVRSMKLFDEQIVVAWKQAWNNPTMADHVATLRRDYVSHEFARVKELRDLVISPDPPLEPPARGGLDGEAPIKENSFRPAAAEATGTSDNDNDDENQNGSSNDSEAPNKRRRIATTASETAGMSEPVPSKGTSIAAVAGAFALGADYTPSQRILIVGDGDFSFSASLAALLHGQGGGGGAPHALNIVATALDSAEAVRATFRSAPINLALLGLV